MMKSPCVKTTVAFVLALVLILQALSCHGTEAGRLLQNKTPSSTTTTASSSQALKGLHEKQQNPFKKAADSSVRQIPPTRSNPTQNK